MAKNYSAGLTGLSFGHIPANTSHTHTVNYTPEEVSRRLDEAMRHGTTTIALHKENPMPDTKTIIQGVAKERADAKERERVEAAFDEWGDLDATTVDDATVARFSWISPEGKIYVYAALFTNNLWYLTGPVSGGAGLTPTNFVAWLVEKEIGLDDIEWFGV